MTTAPLNPLPQSVIDGLECGRLPLAERIADRALALPFHGGLEPEHVRFIVKTLKDSSINVGAGAAIY